jgi:hypothetical protein
LEGEDSTGEFRECPEELKMTTWENGPDLDIGITRTGS